MMESEATQTEQFKQRLYQNFKDIGVLDRLKLTLRKTLLDKLNPAKPKPQATASQPPLPLPLKKRFLDRIVCDYLSRYNYDYTLSIFLPEASIEKDDLLTINELCRCIDLDDHKIKGLEKLKGDYSFLDCLLWGWMEWANREKRDRAVQTEEEHISKKLERVELQFLGKMGNLAYLGTAGNQAFEEKLNKLNKMTEERLRSQFQSEKRVLMNTIESKTRSQQSQKHHKWQLLKKRQIDAMYEKKLQQLKRREKQVLQSLELKRKQCEEQVQALRDKQHQMIKKYEWKDKQLQMYYDEKTRELREKEKHLQSLELQCKVRKKEYEDCIRMVKNKVVEEAGKMDQSDPNSNKVEIRSRPP